MKTTQETKTVDDRDKMRKMSHSAIEKRRRERINDEINALRAIVPACNGLHKLGVLQNTIKYVRHLQSIVDNMPQQDYVASRYPPSIIPSPAQQYSTMPSPNHPYTEPQSPNMLNQIDVRPLDEAEFDMFPISGLDMLSEVATKPTATMNVSNLLC